MSAAVVTHARDAAQAGRFADIQRSRLLAAAIGALAELGYSDTSVADVTTRARVSRRTFYELFADREACLAAALEEALGVLARELAVAGLERLEWHERVRLGLWTILSFFDREPVLAQVCVVQALRGGPGLLERREQILARLACVVDDGRLMGERAQRCTPLTAEGLVGAAFTIVYARLLKHSPGPLTGLLGELMAMIVLPYLGPAAARRERERPLLTPPPRLGRAEPVVGTGGRGTHGTARGEAARGREPRGAVGEGASSLLDALGGVPMRLTYRTVRVLEGVELLSGRGLLPSNRQVAELAGIQDAGQVSKLLRRLEGLGLLSNVGVGHVHGEPNAWALTPRGERLARSIRLHSPDEPVLTGIPPKAKRHR